MSIIVKGMEMPVGCESCYLVESTISGISKCRVARRIWDPDPGQPLRPYWCPLRPLPEKHGRLIDADEVKTAFPCGESVRTECVRATIDNMPTIVEAEGE